MKLDTNTIQQVCEARFQLKLAEDALKSIPGTLGAQRLIARRRTDLETLLVDLDPAHFGPTCEHCHKTVRRVTLTCPVYYEVRDGQLVYEAQEHLKRCCGRCRNDFKQAHQDFWNDRRKMEELTA